MGKNTRPKRQTTNEARRRLNCVSDAIQKKKKNTKKRQQQLNNNGSAAAPPSSSSSPSLISSPSANSSSTASTPTLTRTSTPSITSTSTTVTRQSRPASKLSALQQQLRDKLQGGTFRQLNESMYTQTGAKSLSQLSNDPQLFRTYHAGYAVQVRRWPRNPLDDVISYLRTAPRSLIVADLGCGEARLADDAPQNTVHSFDLVAANERVVACDIAHVPLDGASVDVTVFCLSLMGTNYHEFLQEAWRILKADGLLLVAEVASRFITDNDGGKERKSNGDESGVKQFIKGVESVGFKYEAKHAFVVSGKGNGNASGNGRGGHNKQGRKQRRKKGKKGNSGGEGGTTIWFGDGMNEQQKSSAFFHKFAFTCLKRADSENAKSMKIPMANAMNKLPSLGACIYKRR